MKLLNINILFAFCLTNCSALAAKDSLNNKHFWIPSSITIQHAGSIGYFSSGFGYNLNKSRKSTLDFFYGHVPESKGGNLHIFTTKFAWRPFAIKLNDIGVIHPFNPGFFISYHTGKHFDHMWDDDDYPKGYYWWSTAFRPHISFSTEIRINANKIFKNTGIKQIAAYSEVNTNELYYISYFQNRNTITLNNIFKLGLGAKLYF